MYPSRQIRIIIPPFFLFASLISAVLFSIDLTTIRLWSQEIGLKGWEVIAMSLGLIGVATLPIGFFLSTLSTLYMDFFFRKIVKSMGLPRKNGQEVKLVLSSSRIQRGSWSLNSNDDVYNYRTSQYTRISSLGPPLW